MTEEFTPERSNSGNLDSLPASQDKPFIRETTSTATSSQVSSLPSIKIENDSKKADIDAFKKNFLVAPFKMAKKKFCQVTCKIYSNKKNC